MKYASAMKYGGELVAAVDCDYNSFKELIPLCPNCKEPVYLRIGGQRESVKGKAYQIGPHWCHFKGISAEQVSGCELRVNDYTEKDRAKIAAQARGQRLKLLQRWFWDIVRRRSDDGLCGIIMHSGGLSHYIDNPAIYHNKESVRFTTKYVLGDLQSFSAEQLFEKALSQEMGKALAISWYEYGGYSSFWEYKQSFFSRPYDAKISQEVLGFLFSRQNQHLLYSFLNTFSNALWSAAYAVMSEVPGDSGWWCDWLNALYLWIFEIPWASEFQRLEAEAKQRKDAA